MALGDICNDHGDLNLFGIPTMEGLIGLPIPQAIIALRHGWRWIESYDMPGAPWVAVQRGGAGWRARR